MRARSVGARLAVFVVAGTLIAASAAAVTVPIPEIAGPAIRVPATMRTNDGGAVLLGWIGRHRGSASTGLTVTSRLDAEGRLDLGYGYEGVAQLNAAPTVTPTALAINPATAAAWLGAAEAERSEVFALDQSGRLKPDFGSRGVVRLPAVDDGGVRALAWQSGQLLIAAGDRAGCAACTLTVMDANRGTVLATTTVTPSVAGGPACSGPVGITSVAFGGGNELLAATSATGSGCAPRLLEFEGGLAPAGALPPPAGAAPVGSITITPEPGAACLAGSGPAGVALAPLGGKRWAVVAGGASSRLVAVVPLGGGACAALVQRGGSAEVAQSSGGGTAMALTSLPAHMAPDAMSRCHQHLLVIATRRAAKAQDAEIVPVPIAIGPYAARAASASAEPSTGCA